jgi:hypothetical protein
MRLYAIEYTSIYMLIELKKPARRVAVRWRRSAPLHPRPKVVTLTMTRTQSGPVKKRTPRPIKQPRCDRTRCFARVPCLVAAGGRADNSA